jgi:hypothetical protein
MLIPRASKFIKDNAQARGVHSFRGFYIHGYLAFSYYQHPIANKSGIVYYHRYVASLKLGRWLRPDEVGHHIDENPKNNHWDNLKIMTASEHSIHHRNKLRPKKIAYYNRCPVCKNLFIYYRIMQKYCSNKCFHQSTKQSNLTRGELIELLRHNNLTDIGRMFGVSCNSVKNWMKGMGIFYT